MTSTLWGGSWGCGRGGGDVAQRWLAVCGLGGGWVMSQGTGAAFTLSALKHKLREKPQLLNSVLHTRNHLTWTEGPDLLAGAGRAFVDGHEKSRRADLFELSLLTGVEEDHG